MATVLCRKLKALRHALKTWSKGISRLYIAIENSNKALNEIDELENKRRLTTLETNFGLILKSHLLRLLSYQQQYWKERCTIRWVKFGDENTQFFQAVATERYRKNNITNLQTVDGLMVDDHMGNEALLFQAYSDRLGTSTPTTMKLDLPNLIRPRVNLDHLHTFHN